MGSRNLHLATLILGTALFFPAMAAADDKACLPLKESYRTDPQSSTLFKLAECEDGAGLIATAVLMYDDYLKVFDGLSPDQQKAERAQEQKAAARKEALERDLPRITLTLPPNAPEGTRILRKAEGAGDLVPMVLNAPLGGVPRSSTPPSRPDGEWPWEAHITRAEINDGYLTLALVHDGALDALMSLTEQREKSRLVPDRTVTYIEFIGVAPQHQEPPIGERAIKGLGRTMFEIAAQIATAVGGHGLVGLHAKPDVENFYRKLRLHECAQEECEDGTWRYFEACAFWLRGERLRLGKAAI